MPGSSFNKPPKAPSRTTVEPPARTAVQQSRIGTVLVGGYFGPEVSRSLKRLALDEETTVQALIGRALNDLLERSGFGRPASDQVLPRGGAAHRHLAGGGNANGGETRTANPVPGRPKRGSPD
jgi:hypothetical protein